MDGVSLAFYFGNFWNFCLNRWSLNGWWQTDNSPTNPEVTSNMFNLNKWNEYRFAYDKCFLELLLV